ncbi:alpha/beta hydrolase [Nocardia sp. bgisy134]|uniref:alpha/beta hydrolase n=1 Tax=Nocardia sp. bgisy134 TaxID=3413789 RepID=UPI003D74DBD1
MSGRRKHTAVRGGRTIDTAALSVPGTRAGRVLTALALTALAACGADTAASPDLGRYYNQRVEFGSCADYPHGAELTAGGLECARVTVPLDYDEPEGATASIAISRLPAHGERVAALLTNPGGPGSPGLAMPLMFAKSEVAQRFDMIGVDVRGLGASTPKVVCLTPEEFQAERNELDVDYSAEGIAQTERENRDYVAKCVQRTGVDVLDNVGTRNVARDFDIIRAALGDEKLTYYGGSYGTRLGSTFAEMFPDRVRAMVLDGGVDPATDMIDVVAFSAGFQRASDTYAADCVKAPDCPLGTDPARATEAFRALVLPLIDRPAATADPRGLRYRDALSGVTNSLYHPAGWPRITKGLRELAGGHGDTLLAIADVIADASTVERDLQMAVLCLEEKRVTDPAAAAELDRKFRAAAPIFDDGRATGRAPLDVCAFWPVPPNSQPHVPSVPNLPKVVVVSVTGDPATPHQGGKNLARALGATLVTYEGVQHGAFGQGVACVDEPVLRYLVDLTPPPDGLTCPSA